MRSTRLIAACIVAFTSVLLSGCDEEKAVALKTAAEAFRDKSVEAIDALRALHVAGAVGSRTDDERFQESLRLISATARARKTITDGELQGAVAIAFARQRFETNLKKLDDVKQAYVEYGTAFARLPDGSALGANAVVCSTALGARLIYRLTEFHDILDQAPVSFARDTETAAVAVRNAAKSGDSGEIEKAAFAYLQLQRAVTQRNADAKAKLVQAIEAGEEALALSQNYATYRVTDILGGVSRILQIRSKYLGADSEATLQKVAQTRSKLEADPKIGPLLKLPAINLIPECRS